MAVLSVVSYIGAMCAPFLVELNRVHPKLPYGTMAALAVISGLLCLILPETKGRPTVEIYENNNGKVTVLTYILELVKISVWLGPLIER